MSVSTQPGALHLVAAAASTLLVALLLALPTAPTDVSSAALRVQLDSETGTIVPITDLSQSELAQQMKRMLDRTSTGLKEVRHADGGISVDLQGRFQSLTIATTDPTGEVRTGCVTNGRELDSFLNGAAGARTTHGEQE